MEEKVVSFFEPKVWVHLIATAKLRKCTEKTISSQLGPCTCVVMYPSLITPSGIVSLSRRNDSFITI